MSRANPAARNVLPSFPQRLNDVLIRISTYPNLMPLTDKQRFPHPSDGGNHKTEDPRYKDTWAEETIRCGKEKPFRHGGVVPIQVRGLLNEVQRVPRRGLERFR